MKPDAYAALRIPDYQRFLGMRLMTTLSIQIMSVCVGYLMYDLTNSKLMLGYIGLAEAVPSISTSLFAGHIIDKYNRKNILMRCLVVLLCCSLALFMLVWNHDQLPVNLLITGIFSVIVVTGVARAFYSPTNFSMLPQLVPKENLSNAISWNSSVWEVASITGLGLGGLLYGFAGVSWAFGTMALLMTIGLMLGSMIGKPPDPAFDHKEPVMDRIREGLRFVFNSKLLLPALALDMFAVLFGGAVALLPVYAKDILQVGPEGLGILRAAMSIGAIITAFIIAHRPLKQGAGKAMLLSVGGFGVCIILFGTSTYFWWSFVCLFFAGVFDEVSVFLRASLIQLQTPDHMKGRVSSVNSIFLTSSNELGAFESGLAASLMGTVPSVIFGGCMTILIVGYTWFKAPALKDYNLD